MNITKLLERNFTPIILLTAITGFCTPNIFLWLKPYIPELLGNRHVRHWPHGA